MTTIRKDSYHSYEDGITWDTVFETSNKEDGVWLLIIQENKQDGNGEIGINEVEFNLSEMLVLYWHLQAVLEETKNNAL